MKAAAFLALLVTLAACAPTPMPPVIDETAETSPAETADPQVLAPQPAAARPTVDAAIGTNGAAARVSSPDGRLSIGFGTGSGGLWFGF